MSQVLSDYQHQILSTNSRTHLNTAVAHLCMGTEVACMINGVLTVDELLWSLTQGQSKTEDREWHVTAETVSNNAQHKLNLIRTVWSFKFTRTILKYTPTV